MQFDPEQIKFMRNQAQLEREMANWNVKDEHKGKSVDDIMKSQPQNNFAIALMNVDGGLNIGNIIRSAVIFGADCVYLIGKRNRWDRRSAVGSQNYMRVERIDCDPATPEGAEHALTQMVQYYPVAIELGGIDIDTPEGVSSLKYPPVFIFGSEREGVPPALLEMVNTKFSIYQFGVMRSLNVSTAAGIVMHEATRRRRDYLRFNGF